MTAAALRPTASAVTIVTQTQVREGRTEEFAAWQERIGQAVAEFPGFIGQTVMRPCPPAQVDWVILQKFDGVPSAMAWLRSGQRRRLLEQVWPLLVGPDDVHIVRDGEAGVLPAPASIVFATRIRQGCEDAYRRWERKIAAAQANAAGFQGYRFEPPVPGVQEDWLAILRFDSQENLDAWLRSPARQALLEEAKVFTEEVRARPVRTGFDQWFPTVAGRQGVPVWKQNMLVLLMLYPVVFLFGMIVQVPILQGRAGLPFWLALFLGNVASVTLLSGLVPWTSRRFGWWLRPGDGRLQRADLAGAVLVASLYAATMFVFSQLS
ncbi:MAG TPA: antibiotic biosynthesis monooxygenase [Crenalkalicoccus sp.]|jgi:antibiotic biosynthesis monooxygenase (ABM) superfamily enzyme|nr:antibiotic biosynthesis monooxygenase [Crenalkalicoccus sp.]